MAAKICLSEVCLVAVKYNKCVARLINERAHIAQKIAAAEQAEMQALEYAAAHPDED